MVVEKALELAIANGTLAIEDADVKEAHRGPESTPLAAPAKPAAPAAAPPAAAPPAAPASAATPGDTPMQPIEAGVTVAEAQPHVAEEGNDETPLPPMWPLEPEVRMPQLEAWVESFPAGWAGCGIQRLEAERESAAADGTAPELTAPAVAAVAATEPVNAATAPEAGTEAAALEPVKAATAPEAGSVTAVTESKSVVAPELATLAAAEPVAVAAKAASEPVTAAPAPAALQKGGRETLQEMGKDEKAQEDKDNERKKNKKDKNKEKEKDEDQADAAKE